MSPDQELETRTPSLIAAVVIASGYSRRMGRSKLTLELGGKTFLERALAAARAAQGIERVLVVVRPEDEPQVSAPRTQHGAEDVGSGNTDLKTPIQVVPNPHAAEGQSASVRLAAERLSTVAECEAAIFAVVDQPFLTPDVFEQLVVGWQAGKGEILVSTYGGQRGNPVLFARRYFPELLQLTGDVGGRDVIRRHPEAVLEVPMPDPAAGQDVDTWEDYVGAQERLEG